MSLKQHDRDCGEHRNNDNTKLPPGIILYCLQPANDEVVNAGPTVSRAMETTCRLAVF